MHGRDEKCLLNSCWKTLKGRDDAEDLGVDGKIILEWMLHRSRDVEWIHLAQDRDEWQALANTVMNLRVQGKQVYTMAEPVKVITLHRNMNCFPFLRNVSNEMCIF
jgi:hypothetical protein